MRSTSKYIIFCLNFPGSDSSLKVASELLSQISEHRFYFIIGCSSKLAATKLTHWVANEKQKFCGFHKASIMLLLHYISFKEHLSRFLSAWRLNTASKQLIIPINFSTVI